MNETVAVAHSPIEQFKIKPLFDWHIAGFDASFTNSSLWMVIVIALTTFFMVGGMRKAAAVPGRWQAAVEMLYEFVAGMVRDNVGREGKKYFPFVFTLFVFVLGCNLAGLLPYSFTVTSHIIVNFAMALFIFAGVTLIGFFKNGAGYLRLFAPAGVPLWLLPLITVIEIISYCIRPFSLSVRLFANMLAGHIMLKVFAGFIVTLAVSAGVAGAAGAVVPFGVTVILTGLELLVACLQAYVFTILTCIYLNDAMHPGH